MVRERTLAQSANLFGGRRRADVREFAFYAIIGEFSLTYVRRRCVRRRRHFIQFFRKFFSKDFLDDIYWKKLDSLERAKRRKEVLCFPEPDRQKGGCDISPPQWRGCDINPPQWRGCDISLPQRRCYDITPASHPSRGVVIKFTPVTRSIFLQEILIW